MSEETTTFLNGFIFKRPHEKAPAFVKGSMSIKVDEAISFLKAYEKDGWVNADLLASKDNSKLYFKLNTFKPEKKPEESTAGYENLTAEDKESIPF